MSQIQRRAYTHNGPPVTLQTRGEGKLPTIVGYAAVFYNSADPGTEYDLGYGVKERIMPGAFAKAIQSDDVRALFNHSADFVLGRNGAGTLRLSEDAKGLRYEIDPPNTQTARDLIESIGRGDISGSSFGFLPRASTYRKLDGGDVAIERTDVQLFDVSPVTFPAYPATEAGIRSRPDAEAIRAEVEKARAAVAPTDPGKAAVRARVVEVLAKCDAE